MKRQLGNYAIQEIRESMAGLCGSSASVEAERLAKIHRVGIQHIYALTKDLRPQRNKRADSGKRKGDILKDDDLREASELVIINKLDPDQAIRMVEKNKRVSNSHYVFPVTLATFQRYLRELGLGRKQRRSNRTPYRRWQAESPGEIYQFDISGVKERWIDLKTRKILRVPITEVSMNHPNTRKDRTPLWKFTLVDDNSRYRFVRFIACNKPNGSHVVHYLLEAYREMGVPLVLYTDNDVIIKHGRNKRAADLLNRLLADLGGYELKQHLPGTPRATGKAEVAHQWVEKCEKYLGVKMEDEPITLEMLNHFATELCTEFNHRVHRDTGEMPIIRFNSQRRIMRIPPPAILDSVFLADEHDVVMRDDLTFAIKGKSYKVPGEFGYLCFSQTNRKITVVLADEWQFFILIDENQDEHQIELVEATPDVAGEYKSNPDTLAQRTTKALRESHKARKQERKDKGEKRIVPMVDTKFDTSSMPLMFPQQTQEITAAQLSEVAPGIVPATAYTGRLLKFFDAVKWLQEKGVFSNPVQEDEKELLLSIFGTRDNQLTEVELETALAECTKREQIRSTFKIVRSA